jgi:hypothetical protein
MWKYTIRGRGAEKENKEELCSRYTITSTHCTPEKQQAYHKNTCGPKRETTLASFLELTKH